MQAALARHYVSVSLEKAGSRMIAHCYELRRHDVGFPSGASAAAELKALSKAPETFSLLDTPIVIASWRPVAQVPVANRLAEERDGNDFIAAMPGVLALMEIRARG